uniref:Hao1 n=1 Tax=Arundo donax TaxID=35708 RepID=A0A0A8YIL8_ARUDO
MQACQGNSIRLSTSTDFQYYTTSSKASLQQRASDSVETWSWVIFFSNVQPLSALATSSSSLGILSALLTPASPSTARANSTGLPI